MARTIVVSPCERAFDAIPDEQRHRLLNEVFAILEYDENGDPGAEWSSDTTQALGDLFGRYGVKFTSPDDDRCDECDRWVTEHDGRMVHRNGTPACTSEDDPECGVCGRNDVVTPAGEPPRCNRHVGNGDG